MCKYRSNGSHLSRDMVHSVLLANSLRPHLHRVDGTYHSELFQAHQDFMKFVGIGKVVGSPVFP
jgi:hypothetical protein